MRASHRGSPVCRRPLYRRAPAYSLKYTAPHARSMHTRCISRRAGKYACLLTEQLVYRTPTPVCVCTGLAIPGGFRTKYVCKYVQSRLTVGRWLANMYGKYPIIMVRMSSLSPFCRLDFPSTLRRRMYRGPPPFDSSWLLIGRARRFKVGNSFPLWKVVYNFWCIPEVNW